MAATKLAGVSKIDYVLLTHYHNDHFGRRSLVDRFRWDFIDHGANIDAALAEPRLTSGMPTRRFGYREIQTHCGPSRCVIPIVGMKVTVISSDGNAIDHPLPGGEDNEYCKIPETKPMDRGEFPFAASLITFGKLQILICRSNLGQRNAVYVSKNLLGRVDVWWFPTMVFAQAPAMRWSTLFIPEWRQTMHQQREEMCRSWIQSPSTRARNSLAAPLLGRRRPEHNTAAEYIANPQGSDEGNFLLLRASQTVVSQFSIQATSKAKTTQSSNFSSRFVTAVSMRAPTNDLAPGRSA